MKNIETKEGNGGEEGKGRRASNIYLILTANGSKNRKEGGK